MYTCLEPSYTFTPIAIETSGGFGPLTLQFLKDLGNPLRQATGYENFYVPTLSRDCLCVNVERKYSINAGNHWTLTLFYRFFINIFYLIVHFI